MKICDQIRSVLLTDYIDNELDKNARKKIEEHLAACPECRQIVGPARDDISVISNAGARKKIPSDLWQAVVKGIEDEKRVKNPAMDFVRGITQIFTVPRLVPALAGMILLVLSVSFFLYTRQVSRNGGNESFEYVAGLFANTSPAATDNGALGTPIEEYFL